MPRTGTSFFPSSCTMCHTTRTLLQGHHPSPSVCTQTLPSSLCCSAFVDSALFLSLDKVDGFRREFSLEDTSYVKLSIVIKANTQWCFPSSLRHPYALHERVPNVWLYIICGVVPLVLLPIINWFTVRSWWDLHNCASLDPFVVIVTCLPSQLSAAWLGRTLFASGNLGLPDTHYHRYPQSSWDSHSQALSLSLSRSPSVVHVPILSTDANRPLGPPTPHSSSPIGPFAPRLITGSSETVSGASSADTPACPLRV